MLEQLGLAEVRIVPSGEPPHRIVGGISAKRRLHWTRLGTAGDQGLVVDSREVERKGPSYTYDTLLSFRSEFGQSIPLLLLMGDDAARGFHTWYRWRDIPELAHLVFVERASERLEMAPEMEVLLQGRRTRSVADLHDCPSGLWMSTRIPQLTISASQVRRLLIAGRSIHGLVSEAVIRDLTPQDIRLLTCNDDPPYDTFQ